jgi:hypothetical protein
MTRLDNSFSTATATQPQAGLGLNLPSLDSLQASGTGRISAVTEIASAGPARVKSTKSPVDAVFSTYSAVGANRPLTNLAGLGTSSLKAALNRFPSATRVLAPLLNLIPNGAKAGQSDVLRIEVNTDLSDKSSVLHAKLNLGQLMKLGQPSTDKAFGHLLGSATTIGQKAEILALKRMVDKGFISPGFADSRFAKTTDLRLSFDPVKPNGFRVGMLSTPVINKLGDSEVAGVLFVSPRLKVDASGKPAGFQVVVGYEVDSPTTKSGYWAGAGVVAVVQWNGGIENSPIRKNARGQLGIEANIDGKARFLTVPGLRDTMQVSQMGDPNKVGLSSAPSVSSKDIANKLLKTDDPRVIASLQQGAKVAEQTGNVIDTAVNIAGTVSQVASVGAAVAGISLGGILAAAALSIPIVLAWQDRLADGTLEGHRRHVYRNDIQTASALLQRISPLLQQKGELNADQRRELGAALGQFKAIARKWAGTPDLKQFYDRLPANEKFPFTPRDVQFLEAQAAGKGVAAVMPASLYQVKLQLNQVLSSTTGGALTSIEQLPSWLLSKQYTPEMLNKIQSALTRAVQAGTSGRITDWTETLSRQGRSAWETALKTR